MSDLRKVMNSDDINKVCEIAKTVWHETYDQILPEGQTDYMLDKFQSDCAVRNQMEHAGYRYWLIFYEDIPAGFFALAPYKDDKQSLFLSKIYILKKFRARGLAGKAFLFIRRIACKEGIVRIYLTVNKRNSHAIQVYEHLGYKKECELVTDIGNGYVMDDYLMCFDQS